MKIISMSNTTKIMATRKNRTGKRSGGSWLGMIPHSYGALFAGFGFLGAISAEAMIESTANSVANTIKTRIGRYCIKTSHPLA